MILAQAQWAAGGPALLAILYWCFALVASAALLILGLRHFEEAQRGVSSLERNDLLRRPSPLDLVSRWSLISFGFAIALYPSTKAKLTSSRHRDKFE